MSNITKKASTKGVRYTDSQKKEVVDFAVNYNTTNGRGGQSKAAEKFGLSQLTVASWLKAAGTPTTPTTPTKATKATAKASSTAKIAEAPKVAKKAKAAKAPKTSDKSKTKLGSRYTDEQKKEVTNFVAAYQAANGRGGPSKAAKKFGISPLTIGAWLKAAGVKSSPSKVAGKGAKKAAPIVPNTAKAVVPTAFGDINAKLSELLSLSKEIAGAEAQLAKLQARFSSLKASL
jgi:transposase